MEDELPKLDLSQKIFFTTIRPFVDIDRDCVDELVKFWKKQKNILQLKRLFSTPFEIWTDPLFDSTVLKKIATFFVGACSADAPRLKRDALIFFLSFSPLYKALLRPRFLRKIIFILNTLTLMY